MNFKPLFLGCLALLPLFGCTDRAYDLSDGLNKEITLFQDEIYVPVGDVGPLTIQSLGDSFSMAQILPIRKLDVPLGQFRLFPGGWLISRPFPEMHSI